MPTLYYPKILELFKNPKNLGTLLNMNASAKAGSLEGGDMIVIYLNIDENTRKIIDASFESYGGAATIAVASIVTSMVKGKSLDEAWKVSSDQISNELDGFPVAKHSCGFLVISALRRSVRNYYKNRKKPNWFPNHLTSDEKSSLEKEKLSEILSKK